MTTIKEIADRIGVSKVAVNKWLDKNGYRDSLEKVGNKFVLPDDIADAVISSYTARREHQKVKTINTSSGDEKALTEEIIDLLRKQLEAKDREIDRLQTQVENLQNINADMVKAVRELNTIQAMQLSAPEDSDLSVKKDIDEADLNEKPQKRSFWKWFKR